MGRWWLLLGNFTKVVSSHLVIVPAGALGQLLDDGGSEVPAHDEVDDRVEDGVNERQQEEADASPGYRHRTL